MRKERREGLTFPCEISTTRASVTIEGLHFRNGGSRYACEIDAPSNRTAQQSKPECQVAVME
jgi:hypothetical protein